MPSPCQGLQRSDCNPPSCRWASGPKGRSFCRTVTNTSRKGSPGTSPSSSRTSSPTPRSRNPGPVKSRKNAARKSSAARKGVTSKYAIADATPGTFPVAKAIPYPFLNPDIPFQSSVQSIVQANPYPSSKKKKIAPSGGVMIGALPSEFVEPLDDIPLSSPRVQQLERRRRGSRRGRRSRCRSRR
jgi:hypothetical protein